MKYSDKDYLVLLATCQITRGHNHNILIDYAGDKVYNISNEYICLLEMLKKMPIMLVQKELDDEESINNLHTFIEYLITNEMAYVTSNPERFPEISLELYNDCNRIIDGIAEISEDTDVQTIKKYLQECAELDCRELQLWLVSDVSVEKLLSILSLTQQYNYSYIEVHTDCTPAYSNLEKIKDIIEKYSNLKKIYLYSASYNDRIDVVNKKGDLAPLSLGEIILITQDFEGGKCCGQINFSSLDFSGYWTANLLRKKNGCLYKKVSIDQYGNLKNCPCLETNYGNIINTKVLDVVSSYEFAQWGEIKKDDISICKDCVFRYNCTDCRAFRCSLDVFSKPSKCTYNPYSNLWK